MKKTIIAILLLVMPPLVTNDTVALAFWVLLGALSSIGLLALFLTVAMAKDRLPPNTKR